MRDLERKKTYEAEQLVRRISERGGTVELFGTRTTWPVERRFGHLEHIEAFIEQVQALGWYRDKWPVAAAVPVRVRRRMGNRYAHYDWLESEIAIPDSDYGKPGWAMREMVVLHELAHHVKDHQRMPGAVHGAEFRGVFVELVGVVIGPEAGWVLSTAFMDAGLRVLMPV